MTRWVFLDFDGVLNSGAWLKHHPRFRPGDPGSFDPEAVARLNRITDATGAAIVISSSWRYRYGLEALRDILRDAGVRGPVEGCISARGLERMDTQRWREIMRWLKAHGARRDAYVILEDEEPMTALEPRCVRTRYEEGLQDRHVERAISLLTS